MTADRLESPGSRRIFYFDALRALASFLVIVNHTNSHVFQASSPAEGTWFLSMAWYYLSKMAVPLFVMISGALLLPKQDTLRRTGARVLRLACALVLFSYLYYLFGVWKTHWTWGRALDIPGFLRSIWEKRITDSFWYLYFYIGLMAVLPLWQRLQKGLDKRSLWYLMGLAFGAGALWPLVAHYVPALALPEYVSLALPGVYIGLFFAGHYIHAYVKPTRPRLWLAAGCVVLSVALAVGLTALEYARVAPGEKYWFMDERTTPALPVILCAVATMLLLKGLQARQTAKKSAPRKLAKAVSVLGQCAFGVYLVQDLIIAETRYRFFEPLRAAVPPFPAVLLWEALVYVLAVALAWLLTRLPGMRKLLG